METDFSAVRRCLEDAWFQVRGDGELAFRLRAELDRLIETVASAECSRPPRQGEILYFPKRGRS